MQRSKPIPGATDTLKYLQKNSIPFALLTNGGGKSEAERADELSRLLGLDVDPAILIQSHTPFKDLVGGQSKKGGGRLRDKTVLVMGSNAGKARKIAYEYGFKSVVTPGDILKACPEIFPFDPLSEFYDKQEILPLPKPIYSPKNPSTPLEDCLQINTVLVFNDPRDWAVDIQLCMDLLFSHNGYLGTRVPGFATHDKGTEKRFYTPSEHPVQIIFSNCDTFWSTGFHLPRFGQGAFQLALRQSAMRIGGLSGNRGQEQKLYTCIRYGKPYGMAYSWAEKALKTQLLSQPERKLQRVYMIGDNLASDIAGAKGREAARCAAIENYRAQKKTSKSSSSVSPETELPMWKACLVRTGVTTDSELGGNLKPYARPDVVQDDVKHAVEWALKEEGRHEEISIEN